MIAFLIKCDKLDIMTARQSQRDAKEKTVQTSIRLPESVRRELKVIAAREDKSLNLLLEEIVTSYLKKQSPKVK
jgi:predicted HicB family RNase H-like nuclease